MLAGVWSDRSGPLPGIYAGQLLFAGGAAICGLATSFPVLLVGRAVTGLGAGLVVVVLYVVVGRVYPTELRPTVFAWVSAVGAASLIGAPLSGWLTTAFTWRLVFWVVVPPALLTLAIIVSQRRAISQTGDTTDGDATERASHRRTAGAGVLVAIAAGLLQPGTYDQVRWLSWETGAAVLGVIGLRGDPSPAATRHVADGRGLPSVILSRFFLNAAFNGTITYVPLMLTQERGSTVSLAGILLAIGSLGWSTGSWIQGRPTFTGRRWVLVSAGGALVAAGALVMVLLTAAGLSVWFFAPAMVFAGLGMGLGSTSLSVILLDLVPVSEHSTASASLQLSDVLGSVIGIAAPAPSSRPCTPRAATVTRTSPSGRCSPPWPPSSSSAAVVAARRQRTSTWPRAELSRVHRPCATTSQRSLGSRKPSAYAANAAPAGTGGTVSVSRPQTRCRRSVTA